MQHRVGVAIVCLHISAALYAVAGLAFFVLVNGGNGTDGNLPVALVLLLFCLGLAVGVEVVAYGLKHRRFWAWVAGLAIFGVYLPSGFLPLGVLGLWGLLQKASRAELGVNGMPQRGAAEEV